MRAGAKAFLEWLSIIVADFERRTLFFSRLSLLANVFYAIVFLLSAIRIRSVFYGALAVYHVTLAVMRRSVISTYGRVGQGNGDFRIRQLYAYRKSGILMICVHLILCGAFADALPTDADFSLAGGVTLSCVYAAYKITSAVYNTFKAKRSKDLSVRAMRSISLADASTSLLLLRTALVSRSFLGYGFISSLSSLFVTVFAVSLGIYTVICANKEINALK